ncbi:MAG: NADH-quinone oxidoreductase subunit J, partial [Verrucomicrobia bacterium]|nr:NADH-quinone oxidoreductase subunit J [Verrucomicrobiota bacterium]
IVFSLLITRPGDEAEELARRPGALVSGLACVLPVAAVLLYAVSRTGDLPPGTDEAPALPLATLGRILFTTYAPAVLAVGVLLTAVMIGAALFARGAHASSVHRDASCVTDPTKNPPTSNES